jgi:predicted membrane protein
MSVGGDVPFSVSTTEVTMERRYPSTSQLVVGVLIIAIGVLFLLDNLRYIYVEDYFQYWPALLILYGVAKMMNPAGRGWGAIVGVVGVLWLLNNLDVIDVRFWDFWPVILILLGALMLWRGAFRPGSRGADAGTPENTLQGFAFLGGYKRANNSGAFEGGNLTAFLGGCEVDLTGSTIKGERAVIDVLAFMGGIDLRVPDTWRVDLQGMPILGGFEDKTRQPADPSAKVLVVKGLAMFGGVDIKN